MKRKVIFAGAKVQDGRGSLAAVEDLVARLRDAQYKIAELHIDPLAAGWYTPMKKNHFRSGASPIEALEYAGSLIDSAAADFVVIAGQDYLRSDYTREERKKLMDVYAGDFSIPEGYTQLARIWIKKRGIEATEFQEMAALLFANYQKTAKNNQVELQIDEKWYEPVTELFRGVDCANPYVDFAAKLLIGSEDCLNLEMMKDIVPVFVLGTAVFQTSGDGKNYLEEIAKFEHVRKAYQKACLDAGIDFKSEFLAGRAALEVYTCYPVIPLAFLMSNQFADGKKALAELLDNYEVTVTGGMNLAKAAWNNPSLNALVTMHGKILNSNFGIGLVHGNGGLGYKQGVAILRKSL